MGKNKGRRGAVEIGQSLSPPRNKEDGEFSIPPKFSIEIDEKGKNKLRPSAPEPSELIKPITQ